MAASSSSREAAVGKRALPRGIRVAKIVGPHTTPAPSAARPSLASPSTASTKNAIAVPLTAADTGHIEAAPLRSARSSIPTSSPTPSSCPTAGPPRPALVSTSFLPDPPLRRRRGHRPRGHRRQLPRPHRPDHIEFSCPSGSAEQAMKSGRDVDKLFVWGRKGSRIEPMEPPEDVVVSHLLSTEGSLGVVHGRSPATCRHSGKKIKLGATRTCSPARIPSSGRNR
ncbi:hypothetical protein ZWY2020_002615 [Hordeum vulgare]|nr:hypothetical protein ZWY2020_002615 [Hordeum vulgare]